MRIGLIRHFKVKHKFPKKFLLTAAEVMQWFEEYELAEPEYKPVDLGGVDWKTCYSSPLHRAVKTAGTLFKGEIMQFTELKEMESLPYLNSRLKLPFIVWGTIIRIKFATSNQTSAEFKNKISAFADKLLAENHTDLLIVSHYFVMMLLQKELLKRGFHGNTFKAPDFGKVYVFEK